MGREERGVVAFILVPPACSIGLGTLNTAINGFENAYMAINTSRTFQTVKIF